MITRGDGLSASSTGQLPEFLCIGAQKAGTTTLHHLLEQHPQVHLPQPKELHYFSLHFSCGPQWYAAQFHGASSEQHCGEITPYYLFHPQAPQRIQALLPNVRLIVLLRDPVERCLSQYFHAKRLGFEPLPVEQALAIEPQRLAGAEAVLQADDGRHQSHQEHSYVSRSRYEVQLERFEQCFATQQLLVVDSRRLFSGCELFWREIQMFLGLDPVPLPALPCSNTGRGEAAGVDPRLRQQLHEQLLPTYVAMQARYGLQW